MWTIRNRPVQRSNSSHPMNIIEMKQVTDTLLIVAHLVWFVLGHLIWT